MSTTVSAEPQVSGTHVAGAVAPRSDYNATKAKENRKPAGFKTMAETIAAASLEEVEINTGKKVGATTTLEGVDPNDALELVKKKSAAETLRKNEGRQPEQKTETTDDLGDLGDLGDTPPAKPGKPTAEENHAALRKSRDEIKSQYDARVKEFEEKEKTYKQQMTDLEKRLEKADLTQSPRFHSEYRQPVDNARAELSQFVKDMEIGDDSTVASVLAARGKERIQLIEEKAGSGTLAAEMLRMANEYDRKQATMNQALEKHEETKAALKARESDEVVRTSTEIEQAFNDVVERIGTRVSFYRKTGNATEDARVDERIAAAKAIATNKASQGDILQAPFLAVIARDALRENKTLKEELSKYKARVKEENRGEAEVRGAFEESESEETQTRRNGKPKGMVEFTKGWAKGKR